jgi:phenylacetate-coenzyme A ligase PaaK-like adenylate-forming protein
MQNLTSLRVAWDARRTARGGAMAIASRQQQRLADLVAFARTHSRYYAERYRDLPTATTDLRQLPPVTKPELMARFDDWVTDPAVTRAGVEAFVADPSRIGQDYLDRYVVFTTSGSTGVPALLVQDRRALAVMNGLAYMRGVGVISTGDLWRVLRAGGRQAAIFATGGHFLGATMMARRRSRRWRSKIARIFSVLTPLEELVHELNAFQPALLGSYASALALLAEEQLAGRLHIQPVVVSSAGETLTPTMRARVEQAWDCRVFESYGASEATPLALPCRHGRMHVNADWFILEPIDASYQPVPPGQTSHSMLLTNLANQVQPIIRYELGDRVVMSGEPCSCGSPLPTVQVEGRTDEILAFVTPDGRDVHLLPMGLATVIEETPGVRRFQAIQRGPMELVVRLEAHTPGAEQAVWPLVQARVRDYLVAQGLAALWVERAAEPPRPDPRSGKFRHVWAEAGVPTCVSAEEQHSTLV